MLHLYGILSQQRHEGRSQPPLPPLLFTPGMFLRYPWRLIFYGYSNIVQLPTTSFSPFSFTLTACPNLAKIQSAVLSLSTRIIYIVWSLRVLRWPVNSLATSSTRIQDTQRCVMFFCLIRWQSSFLLHYAPIFISHSVPFLGWRSTTTRTQPTRTPVPPFERFPISHLQHGNATLRRTTHSFLQILYCYSTDYPSVIAYQWA